MSLVGLDVNNEDNGVGLLELLHGRLIAVGSDDNLVLVETRSMSNRLALVLRCTGETEGDRSVEGSRGADLGDLVSVHALNDGLLGGNSL